MQFNCFSTDFNCIGDFVKQITKVSGPQVSLDSLQKLENGGKIAKSVDDHQLAHLVGRQTAATFGVDSKSFLLCPMDAFNGGCQHGFFEYVLGKANSPKEAAESICEDIKHQASSKDYFYCYHGVGHGVMMAQGYDLPAALNICDSLSSATGIDGCWQGVFMENVNSAMIGISRPGVFSKTDPLAPCSQVAEKYRRECYINHAGWLMHFFQNDIVQAAQACLRADKNNVSPCTQSLGLMSSNPVWQDSIATSGKESDVAARAWNICSQFPQVTIEDCVTGAVDNLMNFHPQDLKFSQSFCNSSNQYRTMCFQRMGANIRNFSISLQEAKSRCQNLKDSEAKLCLEGAQV